MVCRQEDETEMKILTRRYAVLIPSKSRPDVLRKTLEKQPFLDRPNTYIGVQEDQWKLYRPVRKDFSHIQWISFANPTASGCVAREKLRASATAVGYHRYIPTDDNCRFTEESLQNLIRASFVYPTQPCIVSGFHGTAPHFDAGKIKKAVRHGGLHFYEKWGAIFWAIPHSIYSRMAYPPDGGRMDDRFVSFAALRLGVSSWVVCMEAPYIKATRQSGGYSGAGRSLMMGQSIVALSRDYPEYMSKIVVSFPWQKIIENARATKQK